MPISPKDAATQNDQDSSRLHNSYGSLAQGDDKQSCP